MHIKDLELSDQDFQMLIDGLDALPEKGESGELFSDLVQGMLVKGDKEAQDKIIAERKKKYESKRIVKEQQREDIRILQGKLLMFKRWLIQQGALKQANDILDNFRP